MAIESLIAIVIVMVVMVRFDGFVSIASSWLAGVTTRHSHFSWVRYNTAAHRHFVFSKPSSSMLIVCFIGRRRPFPLPSGIFPVSVILCVTAISRVKLIAVS